MRYTQYKAFKKHLASSSPSNFLQLYCLIIKDSGERSLAFDELKNKIGASSIVKYGPGEENALLSELNSFSFFSGKQILHFQNLEKISKDTLSVLEKIIPRLPASTVLVLSGETFSRQSNFYKVVEKHGIIFDAVEEKAWEKEKSLAEWLFEKAQAARRSIAADAVNALARGTQGNFAYLACEWEKLLTYVGERPQITLQDVQAICCLAQIDSVWVFGEAILAQNSKAALEAAHRMLEQGTSVFPILRSLRHQIITALMLASAEKEGRRELIAEKYPYLKGQMLEKQMQAALRFGAERLITAIQLIDHFEFKAKDSCDDPKLLLTLLCTRMIP